jgi:hypothetical protein
VETKPGTWRSADPFIEPTAAWIVDCPAATAVARPEAFTVETAELELDHVAVVVKSWVLRSE